jgi:hypothetical protein
VPGAGTAAGAVVGFVIGATITIAVGAGIAYLATHAEGDTTDNNAESPSTSLQDLLDKTKPYKGRADDLDYVGTDSAETEFDRLVDPDTVRPHPNKTYADAGGKIGKLPGGGTIAYRPTSKWTKTPAIDLQNVPGLPSETKIKWP